MLGVFLIAKSTMNDDCRHIRNVKQEAVANELAVPFRNVPIVHRGEIVGMQSLDGQASRVVVKVVQPVFKLPVFEQYLVIVAGFEEWGKTRKCTRS